MENYHRLKCWCIELSLCAYRCWCHRWG